MAEPLTDEQIRETTLGDLVEHNATIDLAEYDPQWPRLYEREADADALEELRRAVYLSPYEAQAHLLIGRIHLRAGRPRDAVNALKISIWSEDTVAARIALADAYLKLQNPAAARTELERALTLDPNSAEAKRMLGEIR